MTMPASPGTAVEMHWLTKRFGGVTAVDDLSLSIRRGGVVGLLGPNGAGKSTTIRMLVGLISPTSGSGRVLGHDVTRPSAYMHRVGALVEAPAFYPKLSVRNNLRTLAALADVADNRIDEVLEIVGLAGRGTDRTGDYSLGMQQRLAIAAALLKDPELVILDEPTNGLDPAGIVEIRELLIRLGQSGKTIIVSSHLLAEIQAACDRLVILNKGSLAFEGPTPELLDRSRNDLVIVPEYRDDLNKLAALLDEKGIGFTTNGAGLRAPGVTGESAIVNRLAFEHGVALRELRAEVEDLEDVVLRLTEKVD